LNGQQFRTEWFQELLTWLDSCRAGVVVFSMGSMVQAASLHEKTRQDLIQVFGEQKQCVLWKWEKHISSLPKNMKTMPWFPQFDVLGEFN